MEMVYKVWHVSSTTVQLHRLACAHIKLWVHSLTGKLLKENEMFLPLHVIYECIVFVI